MDIQTDTATGRQLPAALSLVLINLGLNAALVTGLTYLGSPYLLSQVITTAGMSMANSLVSRQWIFTETETRITGASPSGQSPTLLG